MKRLFILTAALVLVSAFSYSQEICNDGIDNDGDGFIDCFDKKCANNAVCLGGYTGNNANCQAKPSSFPKFSMELAWGSPNQVTDHLTRISIGDLDRDGFPDIVTLNSVTNMIYILDGRDGSIKNSLKPNFDVQREAAIANLNNDNCAEVFVYGIFNKEHYIISYDCNLAEQWRSKIRGVVGISEGDPVHFGIADFDGDGKAEVYCKDLIMDAQTGTIIVNSATDWRYVNGGPVAVDMMGTQDLELVLGCIIYQVSLGTHAAGSGSLTELQRVADYKTRITPSLLYRHTTSVADYNLDGFLDVIATGSYQTTDNTTAFFWDVKNNVVSTYNDYIAGNVTIAGCNGSTDDFYKKGWEQGMGRINIADLDGNGLMNASFISGKYLYALDENFNLLWRKDVKEETSGITGCTLFDFNGDGKSEVVYRDENYIYIINGVDGSTFTQQTCISRTQLEYPIVADVNGDGATELCVTCGFDDALSQANFCDNNYYKNGHVRAFRSAAQPWVPARKLWNQHGYFNVNVNDDLTIPRRQQKHHLVFSNGSCTTGPNRPLNTFLNQSPFINTDGCPVYASPDLSYVPNSFSIVPPTCPDRDFTASFQIRNLGDALINGNVPITFYNGDPLAAGAIKLNTAAIVLTNFKPGDVYSVTNIAVTGPGTNFTLFGVVNDAGTTVPTPIKLPNTNILECNYDNAFSVPVSPLPFPIVAEKLADNIKCAGSSSPDNGAVNAYRLDNGVKETVPYQFFWYKTGVPVSGPPAYTGAVYNGIPEGTYSVYAKSIAFQCSSDTASIVVNRTNTPVSVQIVVNKPYTNCKNPNGELQAIVNGGATPSDFTYVWYEGNDIFTSPQIGVNAVATGLKNFTYTVLVTSKATGCQSIESLTLPDNTVLPVIHTVVTNIICSNLNSGSVAADVGGVTAGFTFEWYNGGTVKPVADFTGATYSNLAQGTYTVVVTNNTSQCFSKATATVSGSPLIVATASKTSDQTSCDQSLPNGSASANVGGTTAGFSFEWFSGQNILPANSVATTSIATGLQQGIYTVKATDNTTGCFDTDEVTINNNEVIPTLTSTVVNQTNCAPQNGSITANVSSGVPADYIFSWYNGPIAKAVPDYPDTDNVLNNLAAGTYTVKATNSILHCDAVAITVTVLDQTPTINITLVGSVTVTPSACNSANGAMGVTVSSPGNTLGYDVQWFAGAAPFSAPAIKTETVPSNSNVSGIPSGVYTAVATDKNSGCTASKSFDLPFANSHSLQLLSKVDVNTCVPGNNGSITVNLTATTLPGFTEGDYDIHVFAGKNDVGIPIEVITGVAGTTSYTTSVPLTPGFYALVAISKNPVNIGCKSVVLTAEILKITSDPVIAATTMNSNKNCAGVMANGGITISIDGGANPLNYTINWFEGNSTSAPPLGTTVGSTTGVNGETAQDLPGGTYTVMVTDASGTSTGCSSVASFTLFDNPPTISLSSANMTLTPLSRCDVVDGSAVINTVNEDGVAMPIANYTFQWFDASSNPLPGNTNTQNNLAAGVYFVIAQNTLNNCATPSRVHFIINDNTFGSVSVALSNFTEPTRCLQPANNLGQLEATASGTSGTGYSYNWYSGSSASGPVQSTNPILSGITVTPPATEAIFTVEVINNSNQCKTTDTYHLPLLNVPVIINASSSPLSNCSPLNGIVFATVTSGGSNNYTYNWYNGSVVGATPDYNGKQVNGLANGNYTIVAIDNADAFCQSAPTTLPVDDLRVFNAPVAIQLSPLTNCDVAKPNGVASASVMGAIVEYRFDWYPGNSVTGTPIYTGPEITGLTNTLFTVVATNMVTNCTSTDTVTIKNAQITIPPPDVTVVSDVTSCVIDNGELSASESGNTKDYIFYWYNGPSVKATPDFTGELYKDLSVGTYTVIAESRITGCISGPASADIKNGMAFPEFTLRIKPANCGQANGGVELFITNNVEIEGIQWDVNGAIVTGPILSAIPAGTYTVNIITKLGCAVTGTATVETEIRPFNGISRNRDGQNETFYIDCIQNFPNNLVRIYNRAGTLVYEEEGYDNIDLYFDGKSNQGISPMGSNLPDGTYYYVIDKGDGSNRLAGYMEIVK